MQTIVGIDPANWGFTYVFVQACTHQARRVGEVVCQTSVNQSATSRLRTLASSMERLKPAFDSVTAVYVEQQPRSGKAKQVANWIAAFCLAKGLRVRFIQPSEKYTGLFLDMSSLSDETAYRKRAKRAREWMERELQELQELQDLQITRGDDPLVTTERSTLNDVADAAAIAVAGWALDREDERAGWFRVVQNFVAA